MLSLQLLVVTYIAFNYFTVLAFFLWFFTAIAIYFFAIYHVRSISYHRMHKDLLILKKSANKTDLMPIDKATICPMFVSQKLVIIRIKYHLDGIRKTALVLTNFKEFGKIKKRQAISRVL